MFPIRWIYPESILEFPNASLTASDDAESDTFFIICKGQTREEVQIQYFFNNFSNCMNTNAYCMNTNCMNTNAYCIAANCSELIGFIPILQLEYKNPNFSPEIWIFRNY